MKRDLWKYYRSIRKKLPCSEKQKRQFLKYFRNMVSAYCAEEPAADIAAIMQRFGTPEQIAAAYMNEIGTQELRQSLNLRSRIVKIITIGIALIVGLWLICMSIALIDQFNSSGGYLTTEVIYPETTEEQYEILP